MGIVSDDELNSELNRLNPTLNARIEEKPSKGRDEGDTNVPDSLRKIIGETSVIEGRQEAVELARMFDISPSSVSAYAKGATSTKSYNEPSLGITKHIKVARENAIKRAHSKLNLALRNITPQKLEDEKPAALAAIAKDMSAIIKNLEPEVKLGSEDNGNKTPQFVIFAPQFTREERFETIVVKE